MSISAPASAAASPLTATDPISLSFISSSSKRTCSLSSSLSSRSSLAPISCANKSKSIFLSKKLVAVQAVTNSFVQCFIQQELEKISYSDLLIKLELRNALNFSLASLKVQELAEQLTNQTIEFLPTLSPPVRNSWAAIKNELGVKRSKRLILALARPISIQVAPHFENIEL